MPIFLDLFGDSPPSELAERLKDFDTEINDHVGTGLQHILFADGYPGRQYLFVSTAPSLEAWPRDGGLAMNEKVHEFYLKLLERYGIGVVLTGCREPSSGNPAKEQAWNCNLLLDRLTLRAEEKKTPGDIRSACDLMRGDVRRVWHLFQELLPAECDAIVSSPAAMLQAFACFHLAGRLAYKDLLTGLDMLQVTDPALVEPGAWQRAVKFVKRGTFSYDDALNRLVGKYSGRGDLPEQKAKIDSEIWQVRAELRTLQLGTDFSRWLLSGVFNWARERGRSGQKAVRILIIDPQLNPDSDAHRDDYYPYIRLRDRLEMIFRTLFGQSSAQLVLDVIFKAEGLLPAADQHLGDSVVAFDRYLATSLRDRVKRVTLSDWNPGNRFPGPGGDKGWFKPWPLSPVEEKEWTLWNYDTVFCEVTYEDLFAGPQIVQKLRSFFERTHKPKPTASQTVDRQDTPVVRSDNIAEVNKMPAIVVLTRSANFDFTHQCLNLGAYAYVAKDRLFEIPSRMWAAVRDEELASQRRAQTYRAAAGQERMGHRSNFRNLYSLQAERVMELQRSDGTHLIRGEEVDREWIKRLPKADLHRHFGTSIRLKTFEALAFNSVGHLVTEHSTACSSKPAKAVGGSHLHDAIGLAMRSVIACAVFRNARGEGSRWERLAHGTSAQLLLSATTWACERFREKARQNENATWHPSEALKVGYWRHEAPLDEVIKQLAPVGSPVRLYQATSLIVAVTKLLRPLQGTRAAGEAQPDHVRQEIQSRWQYLADIDQWIAKYTAERNIWFEDFVAPAATDCHRQSLATNSAQKPFDARGYFTELHKAVHDRIENAVSAMSAEIKNAKELIANDIAAEDELKKILKNKTANEFVEDSMAWIPSLAELVINQQDAFDNGKFPRKLGLTRYLWGCGLLGADHLQFPENLLLGAKDLVEQNADECVTYSEVRCETPGYTLAGMSAAGATDLLQKSFDLAAAFYRECGGVLSDDASKTLDEAGMTLRSPHAATFIRTNILLAAKRHKTREDCASVIGLLERYLSTGPRVIEHDEDPSIIPKWWKPCSVVGFDLSGNEAHPAQGVEEEIQRLFKYNSPITIHAGEAATAESVWQAVYKLHARRIGHGLRLRESPNLLRYCIDEGICMEMCPVSNLATHGFLAVSDEQQYRGLAQEHYPLRYYMAAGLEVCINTDNRSLHQPVKPAGQPFDVNGEGATITDDYLMAAKLSGGFSRWEILKLVRAGFKHAFISKVDISDLLAAAENRVYTHVAHASGLDWRPSAWSPMEAAESTSVGLCG